MSKEADNLRANPIWKEAYSLAEYMYDNVLKQFADFNDEKWNSERKIRNAANDLMFYVAQAVGGTTADTAEYDWSNARKNLFGLQTMYVFAGKQHFIEIEPSIVVRLDKLIAKIGKEIDKSRKEVERKAKKEMQPWLEKYRLWKIMESKRLDGK